jgi:hypothetical protein
MHSISLLSQSNDFIKVARQRGVTDIFSGNSQFLNEHRDLQLIEARVSGRIEEAKARRTCGRRGAARSEATQEHLRVPHRAKFPASLTSPDDVNTHGAPNYYLHARFGA